MSERPARSVEDRQLLLDEATRLRRRLAEIDTELGGSLADDHALPSTADRQTLHQEIERRRLAEQALLESEDRLHRFYEGAFEGMGVSRKGRIVDVNRFMCQLLGFDREELIGRPVMDLVHEDDRDRVMQRIRAGSDQAYEHRCVRKDGSIIHVEVRGQVTRIDGEVARITSIRDVTARVVRERELRRRRAEFEAIFDSISDAVVFTDLERRIVLANTAFSTLFGYSADEALGQSTRMLYADPAGWETQGRARYHPGASPLPVMAYRGRYRRSDGSFFPGETIGGQVTAADGEVIGFVGVIRDVTHEVKIEGQLRQAQKMEAVGTLAGGIAHDFNNLLTPIIGHADLLLLQAQLDADGEASLQSIITAAERARDLVGQILAFTRGGDEELRPILLGPVVREALQLMRASLPSTITIESQIDNPGVEILGNAVQIHQVLMNLCANASHAMNDGSGKLNVHLSEVEVDTPTAARLAINPGPAAELTVTDTGRGIDPVILERIFDPYFTTKDIGEGSGLGLSVVRGILLKHGGSVEVRSRLGEGTTVSVLIPSCFEPPATPVERARPTPTTGTGRLLLVDDEPMVLSAHAAMLRRLGYDVVTESDPSAALARLEADSDSFDVLLTDLTMPHLTGLDLAAHARRLRSDLPVVLASGRREQIDPIQAEELGLAGIIAKPTSLRALSEALAAARRPRDETV